GDTISLNSDLGNINNSPRAGSITSLNTLGSLRNEFSRSGSQSSLNRPTRPAPAAPGFHERVSGRRRAPPVPSRRNASQDNGVTGASLNSPMDNENSNSEVTISITALAGEI
ncbi:hypothetical protein Bhyg_17111, partial [Pseudolycoriella hygida]